ETQRDCNTKMREWIIENGMATNEALLDIERTAKREVRQAKNNAWSTFLKPIKNEQDELVSLLKQIETTSPNGVFIQKIRESLSNIGEPNRKDILSHGRRALRYTLGESSTEKK